jgi:DnaJ homolog subfamily B member 5
MTTSSRRLSVWADRLTDSGRHLGEFDLLLVRLLTHLNTAFRSHSFNVHTPLKKEKIQDPPVEHDLYVTLEEINTGCVKKMKIARRVLQPDGTPKKEDKYVSITVKPGWKSGTKVTFQKEGDQAKGKIPSDIVFIIRDKPHPLFRREGSDLRYTARLTLKQVSVSR